MLLALYLAAAAGFILGYIVCALMTSDHRRARGGTLESGHVGIALYGHPENRCWRRSTWRRRIKP